MQLFVKPARTGEEIQADALESVFEATFRNSHEGFNILVDNQYPKRVIIQKHSNPTTSQLEERMCTILLKDMKNFHQGSYFVNGKNTSKHSMENDVPYIVLTEPKSTDGVTCKCKVRKTTDDCSFTINGERQDYRCICTNKMLYDNGQYTEETMVFQDQEVRAILLPYDRFTKEIDMIDEIFINNVLYKVVKVDPVLDEHREYGILQLVLIRTSFGSLFLNNIGALDDTSNRNLKGIVRFVQMKDKILNSKSRELITVHNQVKTGDYITHIFPRDEKGNEETRYYIVRSLIDMHLDYDSTYIINCDCEFYMWDKGTKSRVLIPCYVEDNRTQMQENGKTNNLILDNSLYQILVQKNEYTMKLHEDGLNRIILNGRAYRITGVDDLSLEGAIYIGLKADKINTTTDNVELGIADFTKQTEEEVISGTITGEDELYLGCEETYTPLSVSPTGVWTLRSSEIQNINNIIEITEQDNSHIVLKALTKTEYARKTFDLVYTSNNIEAIKNIKIMKW